MRRNRPHSTRYPTDQQLDRMQRAGRLTADEAAAFRSAQDDAARDAVLGRIRARHQALKETPPA